MIVYAIPKQKVVKEKKIVEEKTVEEEKGEEEVEKKKWYSWYKKQEKEEILSIVIPDDSKTDEYYKDDLRAMLEEYEDIKMNMNKRSGRRYIYPFYLLNTLGIMCFLYIQAGGILMWNQGKTMSALTTYTPKANKNVLLWISFFWIVASINTFNYKFLNEMICNPHSYEIRKTYSIERAKIEYQNEQTDLLMEED